MGEVLKFVPKQESELFDSCPTCGGGDTCLIIGPDVWGRCDKHKTTWGVGINCAYNVPFPDPDAAKYEANAKFLADYQVVYLDSGMTLREYYASQRRM